MLLRMPPWTRAPQVVGPHWSKLPSCCLMTVSRLFSQSLSPKELWHIVHQCYGTELGLTSEDDDYVSPTAEHMNGLL